MRNAAPWRSPASSPADFVGMPEEETREHRNTLRGAPRASDVGARALAALHRGCRDSMIAVAAPRSASGGLRSTPSVSRDGGYYSAPRKTVKEKNSENQENTASVHHACDARRRPAWLHSDRRPSRIGRPDLFDLPVGSASYLRKFKRTVSHVCRKAGQQFPSGPRQRRSDNARQRTWDGTRVRRHRRPGIRSGAPRSGRPEPR